MSDIPVLTFDEIDSTNAYFKRTWADQPKFAFAFAGHQTSGKGRESRQWLDEPNQNLLFSLLIKEEKILAYGPRLSLFLAVALAEVLEEEVGHVQIKWPNDIYYEGKKLVGILLEGRLPDYLILGVGINVNQTVFDGDYRVRPTSLALIQGKAMDLQVFKAKIIAKLTSFCLNGPVDPAFAHRYYQDRDFLKGKKIKQNGHIYTAVGVDEDYCLTGVDENGKRVTFHSGEVNPIVPMD